MRFKHTLSVFVDNFFVTYKQLIYRLVIMLVGGAITTAVVYPFILDLMNSEQLKFLVDHTLNYVTNLLNGNVAELGDLSEKMKTAFTAFIELLETNFTRFVLSALLILLVHIISSWFAGLGNYATAAVINDRMALQAKQPFLNTLIRNLKEAAIYNAIYVPLSILYDCVVSVLMFFLLFFLLNNVLNTFICIFLFVLVVLFSIVVKMTFTTDWLPALIRGKKGQLGSMRYSFSRKGKGTLAIMSDFTILVLTIFGLNVAAFLTTFGVGLLITVPSSYVALISFELVNYYDREGLKYFLDKNTIYSSAKAKKPTREEFFRGESDENN